MATVCPNCGGSLVNCPMCNAPPKRILPMMDIYTGKPPLRSRLFGSPVWEVQGIDISKWNGQINFNITRTKCQVVTIRYGYGNGWKDASADQFYRDARAADMPVSAYWFCNIGEDAEKHAQGFTTELATKPIQVEQHFDFERTYLTNPTATLEWIKSADVKLRNKTGKVQMPYTSMGFWNTGVARSTYWIGRRLWDATWTTRDYPTIPLDFADWDEWQWSADGNNKAAEYGSTGGDPDMDLNRWKLNCAAFNARYGTHIQPIGTVPPIIIPPGVIPERVIVNTGEANLRHAPDPVSPNICGVSKLGMSLYPEAIEKDVYGAEWYKLGKKIYIKKLLTRLP